MRRFAEVSGAFFEVCIMLCLAAVGLVCLPFYSVWTWLRGDPWWKAPTERPKHGFWNTP